MFVGIQPRAIEKHGIFRTWAGETISIIHIFPYVGVKGLKEGAFLVIGARWYAFLKNSKQEAQSPSQQTNIEYKKKSNFVKLNIKSACEQSP